MGMLRRRDDEPVERGISLWLERNVILNVSLYERYKNLRSHNKAVLRNLVCIPTRPTSHEERRNLWIELCSTARDINVFVPPDEELREIFTPVAPRETLPDLYMY
ncbi:hypothetical protein ES702_00273 [subsurface metagenome]